MLDHRVALAGAPLEPLPVQHRDVTARDADQTGPLQLERAFGDAFAAHTEHVGNQFLRHHEFVALQPIQAQQQRDKVADPASGRGDLGQTTDSKVQPT